MQFSTITIIFASLMASASAAPTVEARTTACTNFGQYSCSADLKGVQICGNTANGLELEWVGACPTNTHCGYIGSIPYCLNN